MTFLCPVVRLALWSILLIGICHANVNVHEEVKATLTSKRSVLSSHTVIQPYSKIQCVKKCVEEGRRGRCSVAGYNKDTKTCYLSINNQESVIASPDENSGIFVIQQQATGNNISFTSIYYQQNTQFYHKNVFISMFYNFI